MITLRKLASLKPRTRIRKSANIFYVASKSDSHDINYLSSICELLLNDNELSAITNNIQKKRDSLSDPQNINRTLDSLYYLLLNELGTSPGDWDLKYKTENRSGLSPRKHQFTLYLDDIRSPFNIGSIFRTAESFGVSRIILSQDCPSPDHARCLRTAMGCTNVIPWTFGTLNDAAGPLFALETGSTEINNFSFPKSGTLIVGSEELGISETSRAISKNSAGIVSIPTIGTKGSLNLSVAAGIALYHWQKSVTD